MYIPIILGTAREDRQSIKAANYLHQEVSKIDDIECDLIDVADYGMTKTIPSWISDERTQKYKDQLSRADGLIILTPEYNHGYPGEFKLFFDAVYKEINRKPVGVCGASDGAWGGVRGVEQVKQIITGCGGVATYNSLYFPNVDKLFDENGAILDDGYQSRIEKFMKELMWYAKVLKDGRDKYGDK